MMSRGPLWNLGPLINPGRMNVETSNLAQRWTAVSTDEKMQNYVKGCHVGSRGPLLELWDPLISQG